MDMIEDKWIGLGLAITSSLAIGSSFVITKKGLNQTSERHGFDGEGFQYLRNPTWWGGIATMVIGEVANFAAYAFAPAILVTPLGALSVLIGAVLGAYFLNEQLGTLGKLGCAICLIGSVVIVLHAPPDKEIESIDEILGYAVQPGFLIYVLCVVVFATYMIYKVAPVYGRKNPLVYLSICATVGSISVMAVKAFGIALKLTLGGNNQFLNASTYVFAIVVAASISVQMLYFNKALSLFSTNLVNPVYYVSFTSATLCASFILFEGFNTTDAVNTISLLCGFLVIFAGVYLLNLSRDDPEGRQHHMMLQTFDEEDGRNMDGSGEFPYPSRAHRRTFSSSRTYDETGIPTDPIAGLATRRSMQLRRSSETIGQRRGSGHASPRISTSGIYGPYGSHHSRSGSLRGGDADRLIYNFDDQPPSAVNTASGNGVAFGLGNLAEGSSESDEDHADGKKNGTTSRR